MRLRSGLETALVTLLLGLSTLGASAQTANGGEPIVVGQIFQLRSQRMDEMRTFQVHRPAGYDVTDARYPVVIVLDGEENFDLVSASVDFLAAAGKIPAMLVVGVPNTDRYRDMESAAAPGSPFLEFITDELVPRIDRDYRTRAYRILVGHSGAALLTLYAMVNAPNVFRGYLTIAPAFGDNRELPKTILAFLEEHEDPTLNADVFMAADNSTGQRLSGAWELSSYLNERATRVRDLRFTFRRYDESHGAVPLVSVHEGLASIFDGWELEPDTAFALYEQGGLAAIDKHFAALSERLGFPVAVPDEVLFRVFTDLEGGKRFPEAERVINRAIESFPNSALPLYYAGRLYAQMGNRPRALETLKKALQISPNDGPVRGLLEHMKVDPDELTRD